MHGTCVMKTDQLSSALKTEKHTGQWVRICISVFMGMFDLVPHGMAAATFSIYKKVTCWNQKPCSFLSLSVWSHCQHAKSILPSDDVCPTGMILWKFWFRTKQPCKQENITHFPHILQGGSFYSLSLPVLLNVSKAPQLQSETGDHGCNQFKVRRFLTLFLPSVAFQESFWSVMIGTTFLFQWIRRWLPAGEVQERHGCLRHAFDVYSFSKYFWTKYIWSNYSANLVKGKNSSFSTGAYLLCRGQSGVSQASPSQCPMSFPCQQNLWSLFTSGNPCQRKLDHQCPQMTCLFLKIVFHLFWVFNCTRAWGLGPNSGWVSLIWQSVTMAVRIQSVVSCWYALKNTLEWFLWWVAGKACSICFFTILIRPTESLWLHLAGCSPCSSEFPQDEKAIETWMLLGKASHCLVSLKHSHCRRPKQTAKLQATNTWNNKSTQFNNCHDCQTKSSPRTRLLRFLTLSHSVADFSLARR